MKNASSKSTAPSQHRQTVLPCGSNESCLASLQLKSGEDGIVAHIQKDTYEEGRSAILRFLHFSSEPILSSHQAHLKRQCAALDATEMQPAPHLLLSGPSPVTHRLHHVCVPSPHAPTKRRLPFPHRPLKNHDVQQGTCAFCQQISFPLVVAKLFRSSDKDEILRRAGHHRSPKLDRGESCLTRTKLMNAVGIMESSLSGLTNESRRQQWCKQIRKFQW